MPKPNVVWTTFEIHGIKMYAFILYFLVMKWYESQTYSFLVCFLMHSGLQIGIQVHQRKSLFLLFLLVTTGTHNATYMLLV